MQAWAKFLQVHQQEGGACQMQLSDCTAIAPTEDWEGIVDACI
jgi:hypothetical protein